MRRTAASTVSVSKADGLLTATSARSGSRPSGPWRPVRPFARKGSKVVIAELDRRRRKKGVRDRSADALRGIWLCDVGLRSRHRQRAEPPFTPTARAFRRLKVLSLMPCTRGHGRVRLTKPDDQMRIGFGTRLSRVSHSSKRCCGGRRQCLEATCSACMCRRSRSVGG
jgi:hypothetical protein